MLQEKRTEKNVLCRMTYLNYQLFRPDFAVLKSLGLASMSAKESATVGTVSSRFPIMMGFAGSAGLAGKIRDENGGNCWSLCSNVGPFLNA